MLVCVTELESDASTGLRERYPQGFGDDKMSYLLSDHLGSPTPTANADGTLRSRTLYSAWGEARYSSGALPTDYTYTGQYSNTADFGLMFYNARWYDPALGRFSQADTDVPESQGVQAWDRYAYVNNSPIVYSDPTGHFAWLAVGAIGGAIGGAIYGYGSQVVNNLNSGMDLGQALTTNIDGGKIVQDTLAGTVIGSGIGLVGMAAEAVVTAGTACAATNCVETAKQTMTQVAQALGKAGEAAAGIIKNTKHIPSVLDPSRYVIPDQWLPEAKLISEVKNVARLSLTSQIKEYLAIAQQNSYTFELYVRGLDGEVVTKLTKPLQALVDNGQIVLKLLEPK